MHCIKINIAALKEKKNDNNVVEFVTRQDKSSVWSEYDLIQAPHPSSRSVETLRFLITACAILFFVVSKQGQEVGKQSHDVRMLCIEKEIEMARIQAVRDCFQRICPICECLSPHLQNTSSFVPYYCISYCM